MADIFISYKREDRRFAERLSIALEQLGFDVWWDFELLSGDRYRKVIRTVIDQCAAAVVLWSTLAVESDFVMDEASYAKSQGKLCPVRIDDVDFPFGFGQIHTDTLTDWDGELSHPGFQALVRAVEARVGRKAKLGAAPVDRDLRAQGAELDAFKAAQVEGTGAALQAFVNAHPRGMFATFVRGQIETMTASPSRARVGALSGGVAGGDGATAPRPPPHDGLARSPEQGRGSGQWSGEGLHGGAGGAGGADKLAPAATPWKLIAGGAGLVAVIALIFAAIGPKPPTPVVPAPAPAQYQIPFPATLPARADITGNWTGFYHYDGRTEGVEFSAQLTADGEGVTGRISEPNTFADRSVPYLYANVSGTIDAGGRFQFTKRYDGTGGQSYSVEYEGQLAPDGRHIEGTWTLPKGHGSFTMERP